jgi:FkbM family methyltransferase
MSTETVMAPEMVEATLQGPQGKVAFHLFKTEASFQIANDIFAGRTYPNVPFIGEVKTILDVGANVGAASIYFAVSYPEAKVYAFEPASSPFSWLQKNIVPFANVHAFPFGFYECDKRTALYHGCGDSVESSIHASARTRADSEEVDLRSPHDFLREQEIERIDILKIDTEGCELPILHALRRYLPAVKVVYVEYHSELDRRLLDSMMAETHVLWRGQVCLVYRGEFCYVRKDLIPDSKETHTSEISPMSGS